MKDCLPAEKSCREAMTFQHLCPHSPSLAGPGIPKLFRGNPRARMGFSEEDRKVRGGRNMQAK